MEHEEKLKTEGLELVNELSIMDKKGDDYTTVLNHYDTVMRMLDRESSRINENQKVQLEISKLELEKEKVALSNQREQQATELREKELELENRKLEFEKERMKINEKQEADSRKRELRRMLLSIGLKGVVVVAGNIVMIRAFGTASNLGVCLPTWITKMMFHDSPV